MGGWQEWALGIMGGAIALLVTRELKQKDGIWKRIELNRSDAQKALEETRREFSDALEHMTERFGDSVDSLNSTVSNLSGAIGKFEVAVAKEYATRSELERAIDKCCESCPLRCGKTGITHG